MAFKRKDLKKASYYVWFLGAKESKGLRGDEYIVPVLRFLIDKERQYEPNKVTLQVSNKGIKIVQTLTVPKKSGSAAKSNNIFNSTLSPKTEQIKHMIPHHSITWVSQEEDIICSILLIYNPITKCPVHVHGYRCDSIETATTLRCQLQVLIDRPENQKKFREIELRLEAKGLIPNSAHIPHALEFTAQQQQRKALNSDGRSTRTENSDNSDESVGSSDLGYNGKEMKNLIVNNSNNNNNNHSGSKSHKLENNRQVSTLYDSLAAELKAKLGNPKTGPILLPPRDYDTISRKRGKLEGIEMRKSTNTQIVGPLVPTANNNNNNNHCNTANTVTKAYSSGKSSSGIGSEEALSSAIHEIYNDFDHKVPVLSSDEEDWIIERKGRASLDYSPVRNNTNHSPIKKVSSLNPIVQKLDKHLSERHLNWSNSTQQLNKPLPYSTPKQTQKSVVEKRVQPPKQQSPAVALPPLQTQPQLPAQPQQYYFPDPRFSVQPNGGQQSHTKIDYNRLQRRQSNPDYFHQMQRSVSPLIARSPPLAPRFEKSGYNYRDSRPRITSDCNNKYKVI